MLLFDFSDINFPGVGLASTCVTARFFIICLLAFKLGFFSYGLTLSFIDQITLGLILNASFSMVGFVRYLES